MNFNVRTAKRKKNKNGPVKNTMAPSIAPPMTGAKMDRFMMIVLFELCYKEEDGEDRFLLYVIEKKKVIMAFF